MADKNKHILISGAGIAGPMLAYWLARHGFTPVVVERAPGMRKGGYAIDIRVPCIEIARRMGLWPRIEQAETNMQRLMFVNGAGKPLVTLKLNLLYNKLEGVEVMREDLGNMTYEITKDRVEYIFGDSIHALQEDADGVDVTFEHGKPRRFDLVVGADGLHSRVRHLAFGDKAQFERYHGFQVGVFTLDNYLGLDYTALLYNVPGKAVGVYSARKNSKLVVVFLFKQPDKLIYDYHDIQQQQAFLRQAFAGERWKCPELLEKMPTASDFYFDEVSQIHMDRWSRGRVVLLGDAGYCPSLLTGQGTTLAMAGAYILAGELKARAGDYQSAFQAYEDTFRSFVKQEQRRIGTGTYFLIPETPFSLWTRNQLGHLMVPFSFIARLAWRTPRSSHELKEYEANGIQKPESANPGMASRASHKS